MPAVQKALYSRFAEIGRVVLISYGPETGKLATIVDIVDHNLALIDGPETITGVKRQVINFKWLSLTDLKASGKVVGEDGKSTNHVLPRNARQATLVKAWKALGVLEKWQKSAWGKKLAARSAKAAQTDFDRFEVKVAKQKARKAAGKAAPAKAAKAAKAKAVKA